MLFILSCGESPSTPLNLAAVVNSTTTVNLSWDASADDAGVVTYKIFRNGAFVRYSADAEETDTGLMPDTEYCYKVVAFDAAWHNSGESNESCATTLPDTEAPSIPTNLIANAVSPTGINLWWTASTDNSKVAGYSIFRNDIFIMNAITNSTSDTGLTPSTSYCYTVSAFDIVNIFSGLSNSACATTPEQ
jgi:chitodextrinase